MNIAYVGLKLPEILTIDEVFTIHYYRLDSDFRYTGESHDFWELLYVNNGSVEIFAGSQRYILMPGEIIFHKPLEFHSVAAAGNVQSTVFILSFSSHSPIMEEFNNKITVVGEDEVRLVNRILELSKKLFDINPGTMAYEPLVCRPAASPYDLKLFSLAIERFLIQLLASNRTDTIESRIIRSHYSDKEKSVCQRVYEILIDNIYTNLQLEDISNLLFLSPSYICNLFKKNTGESVISCYIHLKMEEAKRLIREQTHSVTEISELLGYNSIHYFSRLFKKCTGESPSDYNKSMKQKTGSGGA